MEKYKDRTNFKSIDILSAIDDVHLKGFSQI